MFKDAECNSLYTLCLNRYLLTPSTKKQPKLALVALQVSETVVRRDADIKRPGITYLFALWLTFFPFSIYAEVVTTDYDPSSRLNEKLIKSQKCNQDIHTARPISENQKRVNNYAVETSPTGQVEKTFSCLTSVKNVHEDWVGKKNLLVDIRSAKAFNRNKIPGSMNLPLYMLKFKTSLQNSNIVIIDKGLQLSALEKNCLLLKAKGFKQVSVMQGGLKAWSEAGYPIAGDKVSLQGFSEVTPSEFISVINEREWAFIDLDHSSKEIHNLLSPTSVIDYSGDDVLLRNKMDAFVATRKPGVITGFLVISQDGDRNRISNKGFLDLAIRDIYYLKGGVRGLERFMQKQAAQVERLRKGFQVRMGCNG